MAAMIVRRLIAGAVTLFVIATLCFFIVRLAPGNPFTDERALPDHVMENVNRHYGLDDPLPVQYVRTMWGYLQGDFGPSYRHDKKVSEIIWPALRASALLGLIAFCLALLFGIPMGVWAAARRNRFADHASMSVAVFGICVPNFLLGPLLKLLFVFWIPLLPVALWPGDWSPGELSRLILPAITLGLVHVAYISRLTRAGMLDVLRQDYIRTARAKGLSEGPVLLKHGLRNGITPVVSYAGPMAAMILTGSVVVERIFEIPGLGKHFVDSALAHNYPLLMGATLVFSLLIILFNLLVDLTYGWLDPRVRAQ
jgi:oligopeptide transport system permease protein